MNRFIATLSAIVLALTLITSPCLHDVSALSLSQTAYGKDSFSHYVNREGLAVREELLWGFEEALHYHSLDTTDSTQGKGCGMVTLEQDAPSTTLVFHLTNRFLADASDLFKVTFKLDVWINDMSLLGHDHETVQPDGDFSHNGTLYFGLQDENGRNHKINTSISDNNGYAGWQTLEFSLLHDNSKHDDINYARITNAFLHVIGKKGLTIKFDNLRACYYSNDGYVPNADGFPDGCRIISRCDAESLDGLVISEWYGAKMDFENKRFGTSCLAFNCTKKDDYRIFFGVRNITLTYDTDYICFWVKVPENVQFATWFLEANHVQGAGEYQNSDYSVTRITQHAVGGFRYGEWNLIQLPLTSLFIRNGAGDTLDLRHFRMVPTSAGEDFTFLLDQVYVCNAEQAAVAAKELTDERQAVVDQAAAKVVIDQIDALNVQSLDDASAVSAARRAYDGLTDTQKDLVTNLQKLTDAEAKIDELKAQADQEAIDKAAAKVVQDQIDELNVQSLDDKPAVVVARAAYDGLTDAQKDLVTNLQKLVDAEAKIDQLKAQADQEAIDKAAAKVVEDQINALNVQSLDDKPAVVAARAAYDGLTDTQKDLVTNLAKLVDAEAKIAELEKPVDPPVTITYGDVDGNGKVEATDALEVLKSVVGKVTLTDEQFVKADTDGNGKADATDALNILKKVVGKIDLFPVEQA